MDTASGKEPHALMARNQPTLAQFFRVATDVSPVQIASDFMQTVLLDVFKEVEKKEKDARPQLTSRHKSLGPKTAETWKRKFDWLIITTDKGDVTRYLNLYQKF